MKQFEKVDDAYKFLVNKEEQQETFEIQELAKIVGWTESSVRTYISKRWHQYISKQGNLYQVQGLKGLKPEDFRTIHCQKLKTIEEDLELETLLSKSKEFALLAVLTYITHLHHVKHMDLLLI
jgi:hypothetical protein